MQALLKGQMFPHEPQFSKSILVSVQVPLQMLVPVGQAELLGEAAKLSINP
jgi:hypothetical protein